MKLKLLIKYEYRKRLIIVKLENDINDIDEMNKSNNINKTKSEKNETQKNTNNLLQTLSTRSYLEQTVTDVVMQGMTELAKIRPDNPLEFLGNYILSKSKSNK